MRFAPNVSKSTVSDTDTLHVASHVTLLVRSLSGKTLVVAGDLGGLVSQLSARLELLTGLTHQGGVTGGRVHSWTAGVRPRRTDLHARRVATRWLTSCGAWLLALLRVRFGRAPAGA